MLQPLSIFTYYLRNKRKVIPVMIILSMSILGVTASAAIAGSILRDIDNHSSLYGKFYTVKINPIETNNFSNQDLEARLVKIPTVEFFVKGQLRGTKSVGIFGPNAEWIFYLRQDDYQKFSEQVNWKLVSGSYPAKYKNEVALTEKVMLNKNLKVGDKVGSNIQKGDFLPGEHVITGVLKENARLVGGIGNLDYITEQVTETDQTYTYYLKPKDGAQAALQKDLEQLNREVPALEIKTEASEALSNQRDYEVIKQIVWTLDIIVMVVICMSVALLNVIFFMQRGNEFGLLAALGYSKTFIIRKTFLESFGLISVSWALGILFSEGVYKLLNTYLFLPRGIEGLTVLEPGTLIFSIPVPIAVTVFSTLTILWHLVRLDPIAIIEKRD